MNQQTYERTYNYPGPGNQSQGGYGQQQGGYGGYGQQYGGYEQRGSYGQQQSYGQEGSYSGGYPPQEQYQKKEGSNAWKYAAGGAAGLVGGALLMHEGEEISMLLDSLLILQHANNLIEQNWDDDKYRMEQRMDNFGNDAENFPENAANWAGQQVGNVENFGDRVENRWDNAVDNIEDFPEDAARWTGEKVQEVEDIPQDIENKWDNAVDGVEQFGDRMENAYDEGRDEQRYDDEY